MWMDVCVRIWWCDCSARVKVKEKLVTSGAMRTFQMIGLGVVAQTLLTGNPEGDLGTAAAGSDGRSEQKGDDVADVSDDGTADGRDGTASRLGLRSDGDDGMSELLAGAEGADENCSASPGGLFGKEVTGMGCDQWSLVITAVSELLWFVMSWPGQC